MKKLLPIIIFMLFAMCFVANWSAIHATFRDSAKATDSIDNRLFADTIMLDSIRNMIRQDSIARIKVAPDTDNMDSLRLAIYKHNKAIDDSLATDSINKKKKNGLEFPVEYTADDSLVYDATSKLSYLYGNANVKYDDMDLTSDQMSVILDSSKVYATSRTDSTGSVNGRPVFVQGSDTYESDSIAFNFKTKKGFISNVYTQQEDGFLTSEKSKRSEAGEMFLQHGRYTTCDRPHPDFYIALSRAKVRPGKEVYFGPAHLVVADVPLPLAIPYGFFPFTKSYSSGLIMPTYGDETSRGFYLRDGGYYFAISDKIDLKLIGEIYTKGSWGITASSNYRRRYKYSGSFLVSYQNSQEGDKNMPDFSKSESFKVQWSHRQDSKANPFSTISASVNYASTSYERNNLTSMYNPTSLTQSTRTSSVSYNTGFSSIGMTLSTTMNLSQNMRDSSIAMTFPDLNISISRFYPFRRKKMVGKERWYEKISMSYTGQLSNSISTKENKFLHSSLIKDWRNGLQHRIPVSGNFTLFGYLNINPSFNFTDRMYTNKINRSWDEVKQTEIADTVYGFHNVYDWNLSVSASTKLYGFYVPNRKIFGDKIVAVRHAVTPTVSFSYAPDFGDPKYGYWDTYTRTDAQGNVSLVSYSPYQQALYGAPGKGRTGNISMDISNNIEMKIHSDRDTTGFRKISIIDELGASMSYNTAAETRPWSDLSTRIRLKLSKSYTFNMNAVFATYAYELDENGRPYIGDKTEYSYGRFGRFQGMSQNLSYTFNNQTFKKIADWLSGRRNGVDDETKRDNNEDDVNTNEDPVMKQGQKARRNTENDKVDTDEDGYLHYTLPWSLSVSYGITMRENTSGEFNTNSMRYPYKFTQNMNFSGSLTIAQGWNISFSSGYDFENKQISMTTASLSRDLHCFNMSCSVVLSPYTSYNFSFRCNASTLTDALKYDKRSSYSNAIKWY